MLSNLIYIAENLLKFGAAVQGKNPEAQRKIDMHYWPTVQLFACFDFLEDK